MWVLLAFFGMFTLKTRFLAINPGVSDLYEAGICNCCIQGLVWHVIHRLLCSTGHVKGHPGCAGAGGQLTAAYLQGQRHLLDDSILEQSPSASSHSSLHAAGTGQLITLLFLSF